MEYIINAKQDKIILRDFLKKELGLSAGLIKQLKRHPDAMLVNGERVGVRRVLLENDVLTLDFTDKEEDENEFLEKTDIMYVPIHLY